MGQERLPALLSSELGMEVGHSFDIVWCGETALKKLFPDYFFFFFLLF